MYKGELLRPRPGVPAVFAIKLSVDKSTSNPFRAALWKRHNLTEARLYSFFEREKMLLAMCGGHPNVVSPLLAFSDPELVGGHDVVVTELGCLDVGSLQDVSNLALVNLQAGSWLADFVVCMKALPGQKLPLEVVKYVTAQAASACRHIHRNHFAWLDPRLNNIVVTSGGCATPLAARPQSMWLTSKCCTVLRLPLSACRLRNVVAPAQDKRQHLLWSIPAVPANREFHAARMPHWQRE